MTYWFEKSQTHLCNPSFTQTEDFMGWCKKVKFWTSYKSFIGFVVMRYPISSFQDTHGDCLLNGWLSITACRWTKAVKFLCAFEKCDLVKSMQYTQHESTHMHTDTNALTHLNILTDASPWIFYTHLFTHQRIQARTHTHLHPHISTHTTAQASSLTLFHKAVGWKSINRL